MPPPPSTGDAEASADEGPAAADATGLAEDPLGALLSHAEATTARIAPAMSHAEARHERPRRRGGS
jgi:hypothetical protein